MIFNSKTHIPEVYARERDMQVFTTLLDILLSCVKYDIDSLYRLYEPMECPEQFLEKLGDTLNYKYNKSDTVTANRKILDIFMTMMRYKGSRQGLLMATALCLTSLDISGGNLEYLDADYITALQNLTIEIDYETATITIDYPNIYTQVRYLLDYVRPVGMYIKLRSVARSESAVPMAVLAQVTSNVMEYTEGRSEVNRAGVNFSSPTNTEWFDQFSGDVINMNE